MYPIGTLVIRCTIPFAGQDPSARHARRSLARREIGWGIVASRHFRAPVIAAG